MSPKQRAVQQQLREISEREGVYMENVIETAKDPKNPMHSYFTWDKDKASYKCWIAEARRMMKEVNYVETITKVELKIPDYQSLKIENRRVWDTLDNIKQNEVHAQELFNEELGRIRSSIARARKIADILGRREQLETAIADLIAFMDAA